MNTQERTAKLLERIADSMEGLRPLAMTASLERIADSMDNGVSIDDKPRATMSRYGKVHYALGELEGELHRLNVGEIERRLDAIHRKLEWLGEIL